MKSENKNQNQILFRKLEIIAIVLAVVVAVILFFVPATVPVPRGLLYDFREEGSVRAVELVEKGEGTAVFAASSKGKEITLEAEIDLPDEIVEGAEGYVCTYVGDVQFKNKKSTYAFVLEREGNLLTSLFTHVTMMPFFNNMILGKVGLLAEDGSASIDEDEGLSREVNLPVVKEGLEGSPDALLLV